MGSGICGLIGVRDLLGLPTEIVGVVSDQAPATALSFAAGEVVTTPEAATFVDGVACRAPVPEAVAEIVRGAARVVAVSEDATAEAMRVLLRTTHQLPEPSGRHRPGRTAGRTRQQAGRRVGVILSGGNCDADILGTVLSGGTPTACSSRIPDSACLLVPRAGGRWPRRRPAPPSCWSPSPLPAPRTSRLRRPRRPHATTSTPTATPTPTPDRPGAARRRAGAGREDRQHVGRPAADRPRLRGRRLRRTRRGRAHPAARRLQPHAGRPRWGRSAVAGSPTSTSSPTTARWRWRSPGPRATPSGSSTRASRSTSASTRAQRGYHRDRSRPAPYNVIGTPKQLLARAGGSVKPADIGFRYGPATAGRQGSHPVSAKWPSSRVALTWNATAQAVPRHHRRPPRCEPEAASVRRRHRGGPVRRRPTSPATATSTASPPRSSTWSARASDRVCATG